MLQLTAAWVAAGMVARSVSITSFDGVVLLSFGTGTVTLRAAAIAFAANCTAAMACLHVKDGGLTAAPLVAFDCCNAGVAKHNSSRNVHLCLLTIDTNVRVRTSHNTMYVGITFNIRFVTAVDSGLNKKSNTVDNLPQIISRHIVRSRMSVRCDTQLIQQ